MRRIKSLELLPNMNTFGRVYKDEKSGILWFNWTNSGFELTFTGSCLMASFTVQNDIRTEHVQYNPFRAEDIQIKEWPWISVFLDDSEVPYIKKPFNREEEQLLLFASEKEETHTIKVIKLTENFKTRLGLRALACEGEIGEKPAENYDGHMELVGDSITCGFGIDTLSGTRDFYTAEEDAWINHGAIAARRLNLKPSFVSISGISLADYGIPMLPFCMKDIYPYVDRPLEEKLGKTEGFREWNCPEDEIPDYVVINLGTNDATVTLFGKDPEEVEQIYEETYVSFLQTIRSMYGGKPHIICALGSIEHQFFNNLVNAVKTYQAKTGDTQIGTLKYRKMLTMGKDTGACFHPSKYKQAEMAEELVAYIERIKREK